MCSIQKLSVTLQVSLTSQNAQAPLFSKNQFEALQMLPIKGTEWEN